MKKWKVINSKRVFESQWVKLRQDAVKLANGTVVDDYCVVESAKVAMVVAKTVEGNILVVRQYKHGVAEVMLEFPAGYVESDENVETTVERELMEETGYRAGTFTYLGKLGMQVTRSDEVIYVYAAEGLEKIREQQLDVSEMIDVVEFNPDEIESAIIKGEIWSSSTIAAYFLWKMKH